MKTLLFFCRRTNRWNHKTHFYHYSISHWNSLYFLCLSVTIPTRYFFGFLFYV